MLRLGASSHKGFKCFPWLRLHNWHVTIIMIRKVLSKRWHFWREMKHSTWKSIGDNINISWFMLLLMCFDHHHDKVPVGLMGTMSSTHLCEIISLWCMYEYQAKRWPTSSWSSQSHMKSFKKETDKNIH